MRIRRFSFVVSLILSISGFAASEIIKPASSANTDQQAKTSKFTLPTTDNSATSS